MHKNGTGRCAGEVEGRDVLFEETVCGRGRKLMRKARDDGRWTVRHALATDLW